MQMDTPSSTHNSEIKETSITIPSSKSLPNTVQQAQYFGTDHFGEANRLAAIGKLEEALREYNLAIENGYDTAELHIQVGLLLADQMKRYEEATEQFRIAVERDKTNPRYHWLLAKSLLDAKHYEEALKELEEARQFDPEGYYKILYNYYLAKILDGMERYNEAVDKYEIFIKDEVEITPHSSELRDARERLKLLREKLNLN
jgi:tetratricopeptide (TPR) repeat protein